MVYCGPAGSIYWSARTTLWGDRKPRDTGGWLTGLTVGEFQVKSSKVNTILLQTPIVYTKDKLINKKIMEFAKGKPKGTNPAIMGNPIDMHAVNGSKKQSILLLEKPHLN